MTATRAPASAKPASVSTTPSAETPGPSVTVPIAPMPTAYRLLEGAVWFVAIVPAILD